MKTKPYTLSDFYTDVEKCQLREMTLEETELFVLLHTKQGEGQTIKQEDKPFLYQVIETRLEIYSFTITDPRLILFLCAISKTPGKAVMYLTYLDYWCKKKNTKILTFSDFSKRAFPHGFPDIDKTNIWEKFKTIGTK